MVAALTVALVGAGHGGAVPVTPSVDVSGGLGDPKPLGRVTAAVRRGPKGGLVDAPASLADEAIAARVRAGRPTLLLWEGTTNYLDAAAVDTTLRWCARAAAGSHLIFTYIDRAVLADPGRYEGAARTLATVRRAGERMTFGLEPEGLAGFLDERGLRLVSDTGAREFRARYYGGAARAMRGHEFYRVAHARL